MTSLRRLRPQILAFSVLFLACATGEPIKNGNSGGTAPIGIGRGGAATGPADDGNGRVPGDGPPIIPEGPDGGLAGAGSGEGGSAGRDVESAGRDVGSAGADQGTAGSGGMAGTAGSAGAPAGCGFSSKDADCQTCMQSECKASCTTCSSNPDCLGLASCYNTCSTDDCLDACDVKYAAGYEDMMDFRGRDGCLGMKCHNACDYTCGVNFATDSCTSCSNQYCYGECRGCYNHDDCFLLWECLTGCKTDVECAECRTSYGDGTDVLDAFVGQTGCIATHCKSACGL